MLLTKEANAATLRSVTVIRTKEEWPEVLGLQENATIEQVRIAYKQLALRYHPDRNGSPEALEKFKEISRAYAEACAFLHQRAEVAAAEHKRINSGLHSSSIAEFSKRKPILTFRGRQTTLNNVKKEPSIKCEIKISLEEVATGTRKRIAVNQTSTCDSCGGAANKLLCVHCGGTGIRKDASEIPLTIPPGVEDGTRLKLTGRGHLGRDIYVEVIVEPHDLFHRDADNVYCEIPVSTDQLRLGKQIRIPTLDGLTASLRIPPRTRKGTIFVLQGKGLPKCGTKAKGNLMVRIE